MSGTRHVLGYLTVGLTFTCLCAPSGAQQTTIGHSRPVQYSYFRPTAPQAHPQSWSIVQDEFGRIYIGNGSGVLAFDGGRWELVRTENKSVVRSLAVRNGDEVFVGAAGDFGFLSNGPQGQIRYNTLVHLVDPAERDFDDVWHTIAIRDDVYFVTKRRIFRYAQGEIESIESESGFHTAFEVDGRLIVRENGVGIKRVDGTRLSGLNYGDWFANDRIYAAIGGRADGKILIGTRSNGLWLLGDNDPPERLSSEVDSYLNRFALYKGLRIAKNRIALATLGGGVALIDDDGKKIDILASRYGLGVVNYMYLDDEGGLWTALDSGGIVRVSLRSAIASVGADSNLDGVIYHLRVGHDKMYVSSGLGLYLIEGVRDSLKITRVNGIHLPKGMDLAEDRLVVASENRVSLVEGRKEVDFKTLSNAHVVVAVSPSRFIVGHGSGVSKLEVGGHAISLELITSEVGDIRDMYLESDDQLLVVNRDALVYRVSLDSREVTSIHYRGERPVGRPSFSTTATPWLTVESDVYALRTRSDGSTTLVRDTSFESSAGIDEGGRIVAIAEDSNREIWVVTQSTTSVLERINGSVRAVRIDSLLSFEKESTGVLEFEGTTAWFSSGKSLYMYDTQTTEQVIPTHSPLVSKVATIGSDSIVFGGYHTLSVAPSLSYEDHDIHFSYAAPIFYAQDKIRYQFRLDGRDAAWSEWTASTSAEYTNLHEGDYTFRVKAKNAYGFESPEGSFSFRILPPWYRTWWAYLLYAAGLGIVGLFSTRYYRMTVEHRRAQEQARELARERIVNERLQEANDSLQTANKRLTDVNHLKDEFLATTSHELRTPITAIQGYAAILREELAGPQREFAEIIDKSSQRLMRTLNSVLDLAKLRSGTIDVNPMNTQLQDFVRQTAESCYEAAAAKRLELELELADEPIEVDCDQYLLSSIVLNVLDNAIKFTDRGFVRVSVDRVDRNARLRIADSGIGMDAEFIPQMFEDFKQESDGLIREHGGTGLGLAITSLMIELVDGQISVESEKGRGTTVTIFLPVAVDTGDAAAEAIEVYADASRRAVDRSPLASSGNVSNGSERRAGRSEPNDPSRV